MTSLGWGNTPSAVAGFVSEVEQREAPRVRRPDRHERPPQRAGIHALAEVAVSVIPT